MPDLGLTVDRPYDNDFDIGKFDQNRNDLGEGLESQVLFVNLDVRLQ